MFLFFPAYFTTFLPGPAIIRAGPNIAIGTIPPFCFVKLLPFFSFSNAFLPLFLFFCVSVLLFQRVIFHLFAFVYLFLQVAFLLFVSVDIRIFFLLSVCVSLLDVVYVKIPHETQHRFDQLISLYTLDF